MINQYKSWLGPISVDGTNFYWHQGDITLQSILFSQHPQPVDKTVPVQGIPSVFFPLFQDFSAWGNEKTIIRPDIHCYAVDNMIDEWHFIPSPFTLAPFWELPRCSVWLDDPPLRGENVRCRFAIRHKVLRFMMGVLHEFLLNVKFDTILPFQGYLFISPTASE